MINKINGKLGVANRSGRLLINGIEVFYDVNYELEDLIQADEENIVPGLGEGGKPVEHLPGVSQHMIDEIMKTEAMNKILSDKISYSRKIPDARHPLCAKVTFDTVLPSASVIIIFNNEAWSTLLRTVHSTLIRSPQLFLKEIILVDDASDKDDLKGKLEYYVNTRLKPIVRLIRLEQRSGLIRARLAGAEEAKGDVLIFLDSHCEVGINWLEPILMRIKQKEDAVVMPIIDVIDAKHFGYMYNKESHSFQIGGFTWSGFFNWIDISKRELKRRSSPIEPTMSPTMAGGLLAINRQYFWHLGSYDSHMEIWGGENLEMSFRIWQCGGSLEILPCSRVGHIFRSFHPYSFDGKKDTHGLNTVRLVEVWMDDYKRLFYLHRPDLKGVDVGDLRERFEIRRKLKCKDFKWYLNNVFQEKFILDEDSNHWGKGRLKGWNVCFDTLQKNEDSPYELGVYPCHLKTSASQFFAFSKQGELRRESSCAEVIGSNVTMVKCDGSPKQKWLYTPEGYLQHVVTSRCASSYTTSFQGAVKAEFCDSNRAHLSWEWEFTRADISLDNGVQKYY